MIGSLFPETAGWWARVLRRHVDRCDACRQALDRERGLIHALRRSAPPIARGLPRPLNARILSNLGRADDAMMAGALDGWRWVRSSAIALACLALLVVFWPRQDSDVVESVSSVEAPTLEPAVDLGAVQSWPTGPSDVLRWAELAGQPLEGELANAVEDSRRLFAAVVQSCVPDAAAEVILERTGRWMTGREQ
jgi:hypothetical protein